MDEHNSINEMGAKINKEAASLVEVVFKRNSTRHGCGYEVDRKDVFIFKDECIFTNLHGP